MTFWRLFSLSVTLDSSASEQVVDRVGIPRTAGDVDMESESDAVSDSDSNTKNEDVKSAQSSEEETESENELQVDTVEHDDDGKFVKRI